MKKSNGILLAALAIGTAVIYSKSRKFHPQGLLGIGVIRPKRRIWNEVEDAQKAGIDLTDKSAWEKHASLLRRMASGKIKEDGSTPMEQRYFNQLARAYKSIAGTNLPYKESVVRNENDDVILIYRDYNLAHIADKAAQYIYDQAVSTMITNPEDSAFWATVALIADGSKFVWKGDKTHRGIEQVTFGAQSTPEERKKRISYLASPQRGGQYFDAFVHKLWERTDGQADDHFIANGVIDAIRTVDSRGAAIELCKQEYMKAHQIEEPLLYQDVPF